MARDRIDPARMDMLAAMGGAGAGKSPAMPTPEEAAGDDAGYADTMLEDMIDALEGDVLPQAADEKRQHIETAIMELKACLGKKEEEPASSEPSPEMGAVTNE